MEQLSQHDAPDQETARADSPWFQAFTQAADERLPDKTPVNLIVELNNHYQDLHDQFIMAVNHYARARAHAYARYKAAADAAWATWHTAMLAANTDYDNDVAAAAALFDQQVANIDSTSTSGGN